MNTLAPKPLDCSPITGYNSCGVKLKEKESLFHCIIDGYGDFFPNITLPTFWLRNCVDYTFWKIFYKFSDLTNNITNNILVCSVDQVVEAHITSDGFASILSGLIASSSINPLLPGFTIGIAVKHR